MYKKIEKDNKIFDSEEFLKDKYKFSLVFQNLKSSEVELYSDEENYLLCRGKKGYPTWIWTKEHFDKELLKEIESVMEIYMADEQQTKFTCKENLYYLLKEDNFKCLNLEDYFEMGFLICNDANIPRKVSNGYMDIPNENDKETIIKYWMDNNQEVNYYNELSREQAEKDVQSFYDSEHFYVWRNENNKVVSMAVYYITDNQVRITHVYTPVEERRKGYAANLIYNLTNNLLRDNLVPLLYTDYKYDASNKAYISVGYEDKGILINFSCSKYKNNIVEINNIKTLNDCLDVIIRTYKDRDEKMNLSNENNHRHSNMTYEELKERFDNGIKMYGYYSEEKIIAYLSLEEKENEIKIRDIVVLPEYQNKGIGRILLDWAKEQTIKSNKSKLILRFIYDNKKLKEWYEKYGFKVTEILEFPGTGKVGQMEYIIK